MIEQKVDLEYDFPAYAFYKRMNLRIEQHNVGLFSVKHFLISPVHSETYRFTPADLVHGEKFFE